MGEIVVGVDGSQHSVDALAWAAEEAKLRGAVLKVVASFATPIMSTGYEVAAPDPSDLAAASSTMLSAAIDSLHDRGLFDGIDVVTEALEGHAGEQLIRLSEAADLLVVGARGHGGFLGLLMGSVTTYVVNHAKCPVVVVRDHSSD
jgi:nucleotide-binding universal stress UspA family protein